MTGPCPANMPLSNLVIPKTAAKAYASSSLRHQHVQVRHAVGCAVDDIALVRSQSTRANLLQNYFHEPRDERRHSAQVCRPV